MSDPGVARKPAGCTRARAASCLAGIVSSKSQLGHPEPVAKTLFPKELVGELQADPHGAVGHRAALASQVAVSFGRGGDQRVTGE